MKLELREEDINPIFEEIKNLVNEARVKVYTTVNIEMLNLHWNIGKIIMEIQNGKERAKYGEEVLIKLSEMLTKEFGRGFSSKNLRRMRQFYSCFPIWTHYLEIIKINNVYKRKFYMNECTNSGWSVIELNRQINSLLYERLSISKDKEKVLELSQKGQIIKTSKDIIKDPFVLEFLDIKENTNYLESQK